jgi:hypothetical protein
VTQSRDPKPTINIPTESLLSSITIISGATVVMRLSRSHSLKPSSKLLATTSDFYHPKPIYLKARSSSFPSEILVTHSNHREVATYCRLGQTN